ncbi:MAG: hypothetical protein JNK05_38100 [Myxococcales bacterium]|nr:hypothetical protein [Myxococcales bacterium]
MLSLEMVCTAEHEERPVVARLRDRAARFVRPAHLPPEGVVLQLFVIVRGERLLGWLRPTTALTSERLEPVRDAIEAAIGGPLQELVLSLADRFGEYVVTRIGASTSARECAEAAACVGVQCGWDEAEVLDVAVDGERFTVRPRFDSARREWEFDADAPPRAR